MRIGKTSDHFGKEGVDILDSLTENSSETGGEVAENAFHQSSRIVTDTELLFVAAEKSNARFNGAMFGVDIKQRQSQKQTRQASVTSCASSKGSNLYLAIERIYSQGENRDVKN